MIKFAIATLAATFFLVKPAFAYIDPGTASIALQAVIGGVAAAGIFFRSHLQRMLSALRAWGGRKGSDRPALQEETDGD